MPSHDAFGERFCQKFHRIAAMKCAQWRRGLKRTYTVTANGMARRAIRLGENSSTLDTIDLSLGGHRQKATANGGG
jgi:hypothetical protein